MAKIAKRQYYVQYLGWKEVHGVWGREFTESITKELIKRRKGAALPKLTIEVSAKELKITQQIEKKSKVQKLKYPAIPAKDVTYAVQATSPDEDVVSCIYLGFNPQTQCAVHVHVYRCDSVDTADLFADHLTQITEIPEYQQRAVRIEQDLVSRDQIRPRPSAFVGSSNFPDDSSMRGVDEESLAYDTRQDPYVRPGVYDDEYNSRNQYDSHYGPSPRPRDPEPPVGNIYDSVAAELRAKLEGRRDPLLAPPKDYDTIHRKAGNPYLAHGQQAEVSPRNSGEIRIRSWHEDSKSHGSKESRGSNGSHPDDFGEEEELRAITPHWKQPQNYVGLPRAFSPPPDLKGRSYFPSEKESTPLPNYLSPRSSPTSPRRVVGSGESVLSDGKPRYGPSALGLTGRPREDGMYGMNRDVRPRRPNPDRENPYGQFLAPDPTYGRARSPNNMSPAFGSMDADTSHIARSMGDDFVLY